MFYCQIFLVNPINSREGIYGECFNNTEEIGRVICECIEEKGLQHQINQSCVCKAMSTFLYLFSQNANSYPTKRRRRKEIAFLQSTEIYIGFSR